VFSAKYIVGLNTIVKVLLPLLGKNDSLLIKNQARQIISANMPGFSTD